MKKISAASTALCVVLLTACPSAPPGTVDTAGPAGHLFVIGGGRRPEGLMKRFVELAETYGTGKVVVFTMASGVPLEVGPELVEEFKGLGVGDVAFYQLTREEALDPETARILDGAGGIYFAGGVQTRLTDVLLDTPVHQKMLELYERGCVVGGTSAGAAVMSEVMITGDERRTVEEGREWSTIEADNVVTVRGFGFIVEAVVDQHFVTRKRHNRLISLVLENPRLLGLGIDEATAVIVRPDGLYEVVGENQVVVYDARRAAALRTETGRLGAHGVTMHVLVAGDVFDPAGADVAGGEGAR
jgi:cyanophycinase